MTSKEEILYPRRSSVNRIERRRILIAKSICFYRKYPDIFCEDILEIKLNIYQKALLRAFFHYKYSMWILARGLGKTWLGALALCIYAILYKGTLIGVIAPSFRQSKVLIEDKIIKDLMDRSPFLASEISNTAVTQAEAKVEFFNRSRIMAIPMGNDGAKIRGYRFHIIMADEYAQIKPEIIDTVINPMMNVKRGYEVGKTDYDDEIGNRLLVTSSAYYKHNHLYKLFTQYVDEMMRGNKYFAGVLDYRVGVEVGLFDEDHIEKEKKRLSKMDFDMEYRCIFPNTSLDRWIDPADLEACSDLMHIETQQSGDYEYIMGLDVARIEGQDNTVAHVLKLVPRRDHTEARLVYTKSLNGEKFERQAMAVRELLKKFPNTKRIFMDSSGLGVGLVDELSKPYFDIEEQKEYPPLVDINDEQAVSGITNGVKIIYGIKPNSEINHKIGMAVKTATQRKRVKFYSREAGDDKVKKDLPLTNEEELQVLEAEATRRELIGIESKPSGNYLKFDVSRRGSRKDRWSALGFALYGIELLEQEKRNKVTIPHLGAISNRSV